MSPMKKLLLINGPNLNLLGTREPEIYGNATLDDIVSLLKNKAKTLGYQMNAMQSNAEGDLIDAIHNAFKNKVAFILMNPGALTHTSVALRDAMLSVSIPFIELHLSNIYAREEFRQHSFLADLAVGCISGFGSYSYELALLAAHHFLSKPEA